LEFVYVDEAGSHCDDKLGSGQRQGEGLCRKRNRNMILVWVLEMVKVERAIPGGGDK
jgi:hypothetical protein